MSAVIETISKDAADLYARSVLERTVSNGRVEAYGLKWFSPALRLHEVNQKELGRSATVEVLVDEFDLSNVRVMLPNSMEVIRPLSTQPEYVTGLSLYEHQKIREHLRETAAGERLAKMECAELVEHRRIFRKLLEELGDKAAQRQYARIKTNPAEGSRSGMASNAAPPQPPTRQKRSHVSKSSSGTQTSAATESASPSNPLAISPMPLPADLSPTAGGDEGANAGRKSHRKWTSNFPATDATRPLT